MKKLIYILACAGFMAASCGEELLDTRSSSSSDSETMFSNETYAEAGRHEYLPPVRCGQVLP